MFFFFKTSKTVVRNNQDYNLYCNFYKQVAKILFVLNIHYSGKDVVGKGFTIDVSETTPNLTK